jgi:peptidoglycan hydrolase-like protein with peptidoglycan-binding domain
MAVKTYKKGDTTKLSKNFSVYEFRCGLSRGCSCTTSLIDDKLVEILQQVRDHFGVPVTITSGYRCASYNKTAGGAVGSRHTKGQAADITVQGVKPAEVAKYAESIGVLGIGLYETEKDGYFCHIDTRTTKSFWYGQAQAYRSTFGGAPAASTAPESYTLAQFVEDVQKACGADPDGIPGPETLGKTVTVSAKVNREHQVVEAMQKRLAALGYAEVGKADGIAGPKFTSALAHFQQDNGCVVDGEATAQKKTWRKLLGLQ